MMTIISKLGDSLKKNAELTVLILLLWSTSAAWGINRFASDHDIDNAINKALAPLANSVDLLTRQVQAHGHNINQFQRSSLQQERRQVVRQINELQRLVANGEATSRDLVALDDLVSDLSDINDALAAMK